MRPADDHLNPQEFDLALFGVTDSSTGPASNTEALEAQQHLKTCAVCQATAQKYHKAEEILNGLGPGDKTSFPQSNEAKRGTACPVEQTWLLVGAGLIQGDEARVHVAHAATCDWCGPLLREAMEDLAQDVTPEEEKALAALPSASPAWQHEMGKRLAAARLIPEAPGAGEPAEREKSTAASRHKERVSTFRTLRVVWANAVAALLIIAVSIGWWMTREPEINQLLAQSYQERRIFQLRIAGAKYSPMHVKRGHDDAPPASLRSAESKIRQGLEKSPQNQSLLHQKGRAELLEGDYVAAIATLQRAKSLGNDNPMIAVDLATAYFQAEAEGNPANDQAAVQCLSTVLRSDPDDEIALFNRAIVYERLSRYQDAIRDWELYLHVRRDKEWDGEAQQYLAGLKEKMR